MRADTPAVRTPTLTGRLCRDLVDEVGGVGCIVSRIIGDVLVQIAEHAPNGHRLNLGRGFLISDFPLTCVVLETGEPRAVDTEDASADEAEVEVLRELGVASVLMLALRRGDEPWALVELYREGGDPFAPDDLRHAQQLVDRAAASLAA